MLSLHNRKGNSMRLIFLLYLTYFSFLLLKRMKRLLWNVLNVGVANPWICNSPSLGPFCVLSEEGIDCFYRQFEDCGIFSNIFVLKLPRLLCSRTSMRILVHAGGGFWYSVWALLLVFGMYWIWTYHRTRWSFLNDQRINLCNFVFGV